MIQFVVALLIMEGCVMHRLYLPKVQLLEDIIIIDVLYRIIRNPEAPFDKKYRFGRDGIVILVERNTIN